jgi:hypothetical protein
MRSGGERISAAEPASPGCGSCQRHKASLIVGIGTRPKQPSGLALALKTSASLRTRASRTAHPTISAFGTVSLSRQHEISCRTWDSAYATAFAQTESARARKIRSVGRLIM